MPAPETFTPPTAGFNPAAAANVTAQGIPTAILPEGHPSKPKQVLVEYPRLAPVAVGAAHSDDGDAEGNLIISRVFLEEVNSYLYVAQTSNSVSMTVVAKPAT